MVIACFVAIIVAYIAIQGSKNRDVQELHDRLDTVAKNQQLIKEEIHKLKSYPRELLK